jgi:hypothetical protein
MILRIAALGALLLVGSVLADDEASRAKLMGSWQQSDGSKDAVWTIQEKADILHITNAVGARAIAEFDCDSFGHECAIKDAGRPAKVSLWYSGPKLVEVAQIAPAPKTETQHFKRLPAATEAH